MPAGHRPGNIPGSPASRRCQPLYKRHPALHSQQSRARSVPDGRPNCSPSTIEGEGGPPQYGVAEQQQLTEAPALHRSLRQKTRPLPPDQKPTPASALQPQTVVLESAPNWGSYWRERTITSDVCFMVTCIKLLCAPSGDFHRIGPLGRFDHRVAMSVCKSVCVSVCPFSCVFFWGLSLALRSHDQIPTSHWSTPPAPFFIFLFYFIFFA